MRLFSALALVTSVLAASGVQAADSLKSAIVGSWKLVAVYDQFADGSKRQTWGADPQGILIYTPEGTFSGTILAGDRSPKPGTVPSDPVGPAISYYGTYSVDEGKKTVTRSLLQSTFPQWKGAAQVVTVESISADELKMVAIPIKDPAKNMEFVPHLEFVRMK